MGRKQGLLSHVSSLTLSQMHGYGIMTFPDNSKYEGHWDSGLYQGQGRFESSEGDIYVGSWNKGHVIQSSEGSNILRKKDLESSKRSNSDMKGIGTKTSNMASV